MTHSSHDPDATPQRNDPRAKDFEQTLTFQQRALDELSEVVHQQQNELDALRRELKRLGGEVQRAIEMAGGELPGDEKPPHY